MELNIIKYSTIIFFRKIIHIKFNDDSSNSPVQRVAITNGLDILFDIKLNFNEQV